MINKLTPDRGARVSPSPLLKQGPVTYEINTVSEEGINIDTCDS